RRPGWLSGEKACEEPDSVSASAPLPGGGGRKAGLATPPNGGLSGALGPRRRTTPTPSSSLHGLPKSRRPTGWSTSPSSVATSRRKDFKPGESRQRDSDWP